MTITLNDRAAVGVFANQADAESAVRMLVKSNISLSDISIIGHDRSSRDATTGNYLPADHVEDRLEDQGVKQGLWIGGLCGVLLGFGTFLLPGLGLLVVLGPLSGLIGGMAVGAIGGNVAGQMTFTDIASDYRSQLSSGNFLVVVHCTVADEPQVQQVLESLDSLSFSSHALELPSAAQTLLNEANSQQAPVRTDFPQRDIMEDYISPNAVAGQSAKPKTTRRHQNVSAPLQSQPKPVTTPIAGAEQNRWDSDWGANIPTNPNS